MPGTLPHLRQQFGFQAAWAAGGGRVSVALDVDLGPGEPAVLADNFELPVIRGSVDDGKREIPRLPDLFSSLEGFWITAFSRASMMDKCQ